MFRHLSAINTDSLKLYERYLKASVKKGYMLERTYDELKARLAINEIHCFNDSAGHFSFAYLFKNCCENATYIEGLVLAQREVLLYADAMRLLLLGLHGKLFFHVHDENWLGHAQCKHLADSITELPDSIANYTMGKYTADWKPYSIS